MPKYTHFHDIELETGEKVKVMAGTPYIDGMWGTYVHTCPLVIRATASPLTDWEGWPCGGCGTVARIYGVPRPHPKTLMSGTVS
eukprot:2983614-Amphidinium_carterae.1